MNTLEATRAWLRACPLIDRDKINLNYLGARPTEYSLSSSGDTHREDITGKDMATWNLVLAARLPWGEALAKNISAADLFSDLADWLRAQERAHNYPAPDGYEVTRITVSNAGMIVAADAQYARYQIQIQITEEEL